MSCFRRRLYPPLACLVGTSPFALFVDDDLVVHAEFTLGHSTQVAFHHHPARHVGAQDLACTGRKERDYRSKATHVESSQWHSVCGWEDEDDNVTFQRWFDCAKRLEPTLRRHEQVDALQHVQEQLIATILDALTPPADLARHLAGDLRLLLFCLEGSSRNWINTGALRGCEG